MLDPNLVRENPELVKKGMQDRGMDSSLVDVFLKIDEEWRELTAEIEKLRSDKNKLGKEDKDESRGLKEKIRALDDKLKVLEAERSAAFLELPSVPEERVPVGKDESENVVLREEGKKPKFNFEPKDYLELAGDMIDTKRAAKVSGSRFGYIMGDLALLEFGLVKYVFEKLAPYGFTPIVPPVLIKSEPMIGMGKTKFIAEGDAFYIKEDDLYLVGTAEDTIGPLYMDEILDDDILPKRFVGFSSAFRREAGSYGKDTKGILRVHQFDKAEMFSFARPEDSVAENDFLLERQEEIVKGLGLPYQVVHICTGDMGFTATNQFDIEAWIPSENKYRETHSCSNTTDFQSRGLNIKCKAKDGKMQYVHMLNATGIAIGRTLIAIIENYQTKDGRIKVPKVLQSYVGKKEIKRVE
ncbi:serine--tRNA ligase [Patescibacteria group bacterium]|nr:serine--tRNA ligase [Patescibacteria group bacterium]